jgi:uncharacterized protein YciW
MGAKLKRIIMARRKRKSKVLEEVFKRLAGLQAISPTLDLGNGLTVPLFAADVAKLETLMNAYNTLLAQSDEGQNKASAHEKYMRDLSERMLEGIGSKFGHDSNEYEKAGGKRKVDRKRPIRKKKAA